MKDMAHVSLGRIPLLVQTRKSFHGLQMIKKADALEKQCTEPQPRTVRQSYLPRRIRHYWGNEQAVHGQ